MIEVSILKNGSVVKKFNCTKQTLQKTFAKAHSIAGGLWNGKDEFSVVINK